MRLKLLAFGILLAAPLGCKPSPQKVQAKKETLDKEFRSAVNLYFNNLNNEAQSRKEGLRKEQQAALVNPAMHTPTGTIYNTYMWDPAGFMVENFKCQTCGTKLLLTVPSAEYLCKSCGHCPYRTHKPGTDLRIAPCADCVKGGKIEEPKEATRDAVKGIEGAVIKEMFKYWAPDQRDYTAPDLEGYSIEDLGKPIRGKVRYVRRSWSYDQRGSVPISQGVAAKASLTERMDWVPVEGGEGWKTRPGFHRLDGVYTGEIVFELRGGQLMELSRLKEEAVRPWKDIKWSK